MKHTDTTTGHNIVQEPDSEEEKKIVVNDDQVYKRHSVGDVNL